MGGGGEKKLTSENLKVTTQVLFVDETQQFSYTMNSSIIGKTREWDEIVHTYSF
jgi:hypothetical protein